MTLERDQEIERIRKECETARNEPGYFGYVFQVHVVENLLAAIDALRGEVQRLRDLGIENIAENCASKILRKERDELHASWMSACKQLDEARKERDELKNLLSEINRFVMPGECDSVDGMRKIHRERDELKAENERLKLVNKEIASAGKDGDICPACGSAFEQGAFQECGGSLIKENQKLRERVANLRETLSGRHPGCNYLASGMYCNKCGYHSQALAQDDLLQKQENCNTFSERVNGDDKDAERGRNDSAR